MWKAKKEHIFTKEQEEKVFNLILVSTLQKEITWSRGEICLVGYIGSDKIQLYRGDTRTGVDIQNKNEYAYFPISREKEKILKNAISGKTTLSHCQAKQLKNNWSGKIFESIK